MFPSEFVKFIGWRDTATTVRGGEYLVPHDAAEEIAISCFPEQPWFLIRNRLTNRQQIWTAGG